MNKTSCLPLVQPKCALGSSDWRIDCHLSQQSTYNLETDLTAVWWPFTAACVEGSCGQSYLLHLATLSQLCFKRSQLHNSEVKWEHDMATEIPKLNLLERGTENKNQYSCSCWNLTPSNITCSNISPVVVNKITEPWQLEITAKNKPLWKNHLDVQLHGKRAITTNWKKIKTDTALDSCPGHLKTQMELI